MFLKGIIVRITIAILTSKSIRKNPIVEMVDFSCAMTKTEFSIWADEINSVSYEPLMNIVKVMSYHMKRLCRGGFK